MKKLVSLIVLVAMGFYLHHQQAQRREMRSPVVMEEPVQQALQLEAIALGRYVLKPRASYDIQARVLSARQYQKDDPLADVSPLDLALGWKKMSDPVVLQSIKIRQGDRFYFYEVPRDAPIALAEVARSSANTHILPADAQVRKQILRAQRGDVVRLQGYLVDVESTHQPTVRTSMNRQDTGAGACEILWVTQVEYLHRK